MRVTLVAIAALAAACVAEPDRSALEQDVIGGAVTPEGDFPGVGALYLDSLGGIMCTGTLIAPDVVLTAGHCVEPQFIGGEVPGFTLVHDTISAIPEHTTGTRTMQHEMFDINTDPGPGVGTWYDIGLVFLSQPITSVDPVRLPTAEEAAMIVDASDVELVGYGRTSNDTQDVGVMYNATAPIVTAGPAELQISHPGEPQNCQGDSGGPALIDFGHGPRVVGIVSRSAETAECTSGGIDTRADFYTEWIFTNSGVCVPGDDRCPDNELDDGGGCCSTSHRSPAGSALLAIGVGLVLARRRRRR